MAATIVATVGAANANSFQTIAEIDTYFEGRAPIAVSEGWIDADAAEKIASAITATIWMKSLIVWTGFITSLTQALPWPT
jgi:hypothetical protein